MRKMVAILIIFLLFTLTSGCTNKVTTETMFVSGKHVKHVDDHKEYRVVFIDHNSKRIEYNKDNAQVVFNKMNISKSYDVTFDEKGYIRTVNGTPI